MCVCVCHIHLHGQIMSLLTLRLHMYFIRISDTRPISMGFTCKAAF